MSLQNDLKLPNPFSHKGHEAMFNIAVTGTMLTKEFVKILRPFGITDVQFNILMLLKYQSDGGRITQTRIGEMLLVNRSNVTGLIDRMEKSGLVRRVSDPKDRRINSIEMTYMGFDTLVKAHEVYHKRLEEIMTSLSDSAHDSLCNNLELIRDQL